MRDWFERRGERYVRVDWLEAGRFERDPLYIEIPAWEVLEARDLEGDVRVFRERRPEELEAESEAGAQVSGGGGETAGAAAPADEPAPADEESAEPRAWIEIELQDADGKPIASETCRITLVDGSVVERATDKYGVVRVDGIDPGKCKVGFPKLADGVWAPA